MKYECSQRKFKDKDIKKVFNTEKRVCIECNSNIMDKPTFVFGGAPGPTKTYIKCQNCQTEYMATKNKLLELYIQISEY